MGYEVRCGWCPFGAQRVHLLFLAGRQNGWAIVFISFFNHSYLCLYSYGFVWLQPSSLLCTPDCVYMWFSQNCLLHCIFRWWTQHISKWFHLSTKIHQHQSFLSVWHARVGFVARRSGPWIYPFWFGIPSSDEMEATGKYVEINVWIVA